MTTWRTPDDGSTMVRIPKERAMSPEEKTRALAFINAGSSYGWLQALGYHLADWGNGVEDNALFLPDLSRILLAGEDNFVKTYGKDTPNPPRRVVFYPPERNENSTGQVVDMQDLVPTIRAFHQAYLTGPRRATTYAARMLTCEPYVYSGHCLLCTKNEGHVILSDTRAPIRSGFRFWFNETGFSIELMQLMGDRGGGRASNDRVITAGICQNCRWGCEYCGVAPRPPIGAELLTALIVDRACLDCRGRQLTSIEPPKPGKSDLRKLNRNFRIEKVR